MIPGLDVPYYGISEIQLHGRRIVVTDGANMMEAAFYALMPATIPSTVCFVLQSFQYEDLATWPSWYRVQYRRIRRPCI